MRAEVLALLVWARMAASAAALPGAPMPEPVYEAPIDRALANVSAMQDLSPAQRERLLGRLNLLAYARDDAAFTYSRRFDQLHEDGGVPCTDARAGRPYEPILPPGQAPARVSGNADPVAAQELCARWVYRFGLDAAAEIPDMGAATQRSAAAQARLQAARMHYARAIELDDTNLRARLGHAYVLDRLGWIEAARSELHSIVRIARPRLAGAEGDWETHAVLTEALLHLEHLAQTAAERRDLARMRARLARQSLVNYVTPILAPLADLPFNRLIQPASPVAFDFAGTGDTRAQGWLTPDAAWLVWDPQRRGQIRSGFDMIGQRTWAVFWSDGFETLRALDDNRDGELTGAELAGLALWRDVNSDGVSDPGEVSPLEAHGVVGLAVRGGAVRPGLLVAPDGVRMNNGARLPLYDWTPNRAATPSS